MTINPRIVLSAASILTAGALVAGSTFAFFSDQAQSTNNVFATGNADLVIANANSDNSPLLNYSNSIAGINVTGMAPGQSTSKIFWLKNDSSASGISLSTTADVANLSGNTGVGQLGDKFLIKWRCDLNNTGLSDDDSYTLEFSANAWVAGGNASLGTIGPNQAPSNATTFSDTDEHLCEMVGTVDETAGNEIISQSITLDLVYDATQVP